MEGTFARSWHIFKMSVEVIKQDKELLLFPLLAGIFSIAFIVAMVFPTFFVSMFNTSAESSAGFSSELSEYAIIFVLYLGLALITTFFNFCVVYTTKKRFEGGNATFFESLGSAFSKFHLILAWSMVSATVGLLLHLLERGGRRSRGGGNLIASIITRVLGAAWSVVALFVVPGMVYHDLGPIDAIKRSVQTIKKTWGESLIRHYGLGLVQLLFIVAGFVIGGGLIYLSIPLGKSTFFVAIGTVVLYFIGTILFFSIANSVFNTALFVYAETGKVPGSFEKEPIENALGNSGSMIKPGN